MYDFLRGSVSSVDASGRLSFDVNGIGYSLRISEQTRRSIPLDGSTLTLYVRLQVKDDDLVLFGFSDVSERAAFDLLTSVQQVGPSVAMAVLSNLGVAELRRVLIARDVASLRRVKGVGPKSAERIVLELADKVERIPAPLTAPVPGAAPSGALAVEEAQRALVVLGFGAKDAADALGKVAKPGMASEEILRAALGILR
ncbi:MAG: Holliday junction branch migration protein RuvA [Planctomycetes bacterium]|nr:Holliday junction branch migration protein RuvA [Planctomycetota bacterium]